MKLNQVRPGMRVEGGRHGTADYDHGTVLSIDNEDVKVVWDSGTTTTQKASVLSPDTDGYALYDSETGAWLTPNDLGLQDREYHDLLIDSLLSQETQGHVSTDDGRRVYAC